MTTETSGEQVSRMLFGPSAGEQIAGGVQSGLLNRGLSGLSSTEAIRRANMGLPVDARAQAEKELAQLKSLPYRAQLESLGMDTSPYRKWEGLDEANFNRVFTSTLRGFGPNGAAFGDPGDKERMLADKAALEQALSGYVDKRASELGAEVEAVKSSPIAQLQNQLTDYIKQFSAGVGPEAIKATTTGLQGLRQNYDQITDAANELGPASLQLTQDVLNQDIQATPEEIAAIQAISDAARTQGMNELERYGQNMFRDIVQGMPERGLFGGLNPETGKYQFSADIPDRFNQVGAELSRQKGNLESTLAQFRAQNQLDYPLRARPTMMGLAQGANVPGAFLTSMGAAGNLAQAGAGAYSGNILPSLNAMVGNQVLSGQLFQDLNTMPWLGLQPAQSVFSSLLQPRMAQMSTTFNQTQGGTLPALSGAAGMVGALGGAAMGAAGMSGKLGK